jgi:hypothetical protein
VNHFFAWIAAEALRGRPGIIDKYIGDEVMVVFSEEFGSEDPFVDAVQAARWMGQKDVYGFGPHVGIACGEVIVGYVGTPLRYSCSVFGAPVAMAARCAGLSAPGDTRYSSTITFPAADWGERDFNVVFPPERVRGSDGSIHEVPHSRELLDPRPVELRNLGQAEVQHAVNRGVCFRWEFVPSVRWRAALPRPVHIERLAPERDHDSFVNEQPLSSGMHPNDGAPPAQAECSG